MATRGIIVREMEVRYKAGTERMVTPRITDVADVHEFFRSTLADFTQEVFIIMALDNKFKVIGWIEISRGTLDETYVHPRDIFKFALLCNAAKVIAVHNHPSNDPTPSNEDIRVTKSLKESGDFIGIELLDHVILCETEFYSMKGNGHLD